MAHVIDVRTRGNTDIVDITPQLLQAVRESGAKEGIVCAAVVGSTASLTTVEFEPGLVADLQRACERLAPKDVVYARIIGA